MIKRFLSALLLCIIITSCIAHAETFFEIETLSAMLTIPDDMEAILLEDDDVIMVEIDDHKDESIAYYIVYSYDETLKSYKHINDMPRKLRDRMIAYYSELYQGNGANIEKYFDSAPMLTVHGIGKDGNDYAMLVFFMHGMIISTYAVKAGSITTRELSNVMYFAEEGLRGIVKAVLEEMPMG